LSFLDLAVLRASNLTFRVAKRYGTTASVHGDKW
jgi:hypothetical protein